MTTGEQRILVLHGPNLNGLGWRQPEIYGRTTLDDINNALIARGKERGFVVVPFQSNYEGALIDFLQAEARNCIGIVINPAGLTHTSVSLRDAIVATDKPTIEVHLSNVHAREEFRHFSYIAPIARGQVAGLGWRGYCYALDEIMTTYEEQQAKAAS